MEIPERVLRHIGQEGISEQTRRLYLKAWEGKSLRAIIKAKCLDCVCFEDVQLRIRECDVVVCPLHRLRPYR